MRSSEEIRTAARLRLTEDLQPGQAVDRCRVSEAVSSVAPLLEAATFDALVSELLAEVHGLGPLEPLLADPSVTDVMITADRGTWVERSGTLQDTGLSLTTAQVEHLVERIVAPLGLRVDRASPMVDARLPDGSRVNVVLPPIAVDGPCVSIRRFGARTFELDEVAAPPVASLLAQAVRARMNILVVGGTGSGKTSLLNALCTHITDAERIVTIEDAAELRLPLRHVVRLESRPDNSEGMGKVTLRELFRNALRMRPDRIIVGEVRGPEAVDMLQAMNTGHEGSMSTCHANSAAESVWRLETMVLMADLGIPLAAVRRQIASSVDLVATMERVGDGSRRVAEVVEIGDLDSDQPVRCLADSRHVIALPERTARWS